MSRDRLSDRPSSSSGGGDTKKPEWRVVYRNTPEWWRSATEIGEIVWWKEEAGQLWLGWAIRQAHKAASRYQGCLSAPDYEIMESVAGILTQLYWRTGNGQDNLVVANVQVVDVCVAMVRALSHTSFVERNMLARYCCMRVLASIHEYDQNLIMEGGVESQQERVQLLVGLLAAKEKDSAVADYSYNHSSGKTNGFGLHQESRRLASNILTDILPVCALNDSAATMYMATCGAEKAFESLLCGHYGRFGNADQPPAIFLRAMVHLLKLPGCLALFQKTRIGCMLLNKSEGSTAIVEKASAGSLRTNTDDLELLIRFLCFPGLSGQAVPWCDLYREARQNENAKYGNVEAQAADDAESEVLRAAGSKSKREEHHRVHVNREEAGSNIEALAKACGLTKQPKY